MNIHGNQAHLCLYCLGITTLGYWLNLTNRVHEIANSKKVNYLGFQVTLADFVVFGSTLKAESDCVMVLS